MGNGLDRQMFFQLVHDFVHLVTRNQHHSPQGLHRHIVKGPSASQTRVALLLYRVAEPQDCLLNHKQPQEKFMTQRHNALLRQQRLLLDTRLRNSSRRRKPNAESNTQEWDIQAEARKCSPTASNRPEEHGQRGTSSEVPFLCCSVMKPLMLTLWFTK